MSNKETFHIPIPEGIDRSEVEVLADIYRQALSKEFKNTPKDDVKIEKSGVQGAIDGLSGFAFLILSIPSSWLATKWIDDYLWPEIKKRIDKPSKELVGWIFSLNKSKNSNSQNEDKKES